MSKPLLFISHKHSDKEIASAISKFLRQRTLGQIDIFQSSNPAFEGPRLGASINTELNQALWRCDVLVLVYTSMDNDWSYCMYECGVANNPDSQATKTIVIQCGKDIPALFQDKLRVNPRSMDDIKKFSRDVLTSPDFFPTLKQALAPDADLETIENAGKELFDNLAKCLPEPINNIEEWPAWPFLKIELPQSEIQKILNAGSAERLSVAKEVVKQHGTVIKSDARIAQIFGLTSLPDRGSFTDLLKVWNDNYPNEKALWFDSCCEQIMIGSRREFPVIKNVSLKEVNGNAEYTPVMSRVKYLAFSNSSQFDIYFYVLNDPRAVPVTSKMIRIESMFVKRLGKATPDSIKVMDLINELEKRGLNRIPFLTDDNIPLYMVHRSMIEQFVTKSVIRMPTVSPIDYHLQQMLDDTYYKEIFESTFVLVPLNASLAEAKSVMLSRPNCSDIFITENGKIGEPVLGYLTGTDIMKAD